MKFALLYLLVLTIILIFNYGAHSEERKENELIEGEESGSIRDVTSPIFQ